MPSSENSTTRSVHAATAALAVTWLLALTLFVVDTVEAVLHAYLSFDRPLELWTQREVWGPIAYVMDVTNWTSGGRQALLGTVVTILVLLFLSLRSGILMVVSSAASLWESVMKPIIHRPRPSASLVAVHARETGFSYPSGHATFYTWLFLCLVLVLTPFVPRQWRPVVWVMGVALALIAGLGRVWVGVHWPSDVAGGFLLSVLWVAAVWTVGARLLPPGRLPRGLVAALRSRAAAPK